MNRDERLVLVSAQIFCDKLRTNIASRLAKSRNCQHDQALFFSASLPRRLPTFCMAAESVSAEDICLVQCHACVDILQSVVEKLRLLPYPSAQSREQYVKLASKSIGINEIGRQCVVFGLVMVALRNTLSGKASPPNSTICEVVKKCFAAVTQLRDKMNQSINTLMTLSNTRTISSDLYLQTFFKTMGKIEKKLDNCSVKLDALLDECGLVSKATLVKSVKRLAVKLDDGLFSLQIEDIHEQLTRIAVEEARLKAETALTSNTRLNSELKSNQAKEKETHGAIVRRIMDPTFVSDKIPAQVSIGALDRQGQAVGPRTASTKREPFWKSDLSSPARADCDLQKHEDPVLSSQAEDSAPSSWPMPPTDTNHHTTDDVYHEDNYVAITIDEVYDSYHDHANDATLGLPGSDAVTALQRQPSHKMKLNKKTMTRTKSFSDLHRRATGAMACDKENNTITEPRTPGGVKSILKKTMTTDRGSPVPLRDTSNRSKTPMAIDQIRDQYY